MRAKLRAFMRDLGRIVGPMELLALAGLAACVVALWWIHPAAGLFFAGTALLTVAYLGATR
jgi:hypothetical protein